MKGILKNCKKGLLCLVALALMLVPALALAPAANAAKADFCGKQWGDTWGDRYEYHMNVAICPDKIVYTGYFGQGGFYEEGSLTVTGLEWSESNQPWATWGYIDGWHVRGTISEVTGGAATINGADLLTGETYETEFYMGPDNEYIVDWFIDWNFNLIDTYDCETPITPVDRPVTPNPATSDISAVTMIATSIAAIAVITGAAVVLKKQV